MKAELLSLMNSPCRRSPSEPGVPDSHREWIGAGCITELLAAPLTEADQSCLWFRPGLFAGLNMATYRAALHELI